MPHRARTRRMLVCVAAALPVLWSTVATNEQRAPLAVIEKAYQANNIGVGWLEQFEYKKAADRFDEALRLDASLGIARFNLALAHFYDNQPAAAERDARLAERLLPSAPHPHYLLGLVARAQNRAADAAAAFGRVLQIDPNDVGANIGMGQVRLQQGDAAAAAAAFQRAFDADPSNATAAYNLSISLTRAGRAQDGRVMLERFQVLRGSGTATTMGTGYLQQGQYAEALVSTGAEPDLVTPGTPAVQFVDEPLGSVGQAAPRASPQLASSVAALGGGLAAVDVDGDGDLDVVEVAPAREWLWHNDGRGRFTAAATPPFQRPKGSVGVGAVASDVTNDGLPDLLVLRLHGTALYRNQGGGRFADVTPAAGLRIGDDLVTSAALVDADHDGDLDILLGAFATVAPGTTTSAGAPPSLDRSPAGTARLYRNDGNGRFTDITGTSGIGGGRVVGLLPTDYDDRRDVDLLVVPAGGPLGLFRNLRDGTFRDGSREAGLAGTAPWTALTAGDLNKDGRTDVYLGRADGPGLIALSAAPGRFRSTPAPDVTSGTRAALLIDYDNDGLLDLLVSTAGGTRLLRSLGTGWLDVTERALPQARTGAVLPPIAGGRLWVAGDVDGDGDTDLVLRYGGSVRLWRNQGGNAQPSLAVRLAGRASNRGGVGAKVELRAGSLRERRETTAVTPPTGPSDVLFGLGARRTVDAVRVLWPSGILQAELTAGLAKSPVAITELDRKPSSCPFLYTWNGRTFEFVTDFLGGGEIGYWVAPGVRNEPDPDEVVRIPAERLVPRHGRYELRVTNELEEVLFLDAVRLYTVDHPEGTEVHADEGLVSRPRAGMRLVALRNLTTPATARDERGRNVGALVAGEDFRAVDGFARVSIRGYAEPHALSVTPRRGADADWLVLSGWTDYAYSSDNVAASHAGLHLSAPTLDVQDTDGTWRETGLEVPVPAGRPQTVLVDLRRHDATRARAFRIRTNMRIYWDRVRFAAAARDVRLEPAELRRASSSLQARGFSRERTPAPGGPLLYDYHVVSAISPWKRFVGTASAEGPVTEALAAVDDQFAIAVAGDEIALAFAATNVPPLAPGRSRTFFLEANGFSKEMNLHSASPDTIAPVPYHGMRTYPPLPCLAPRLAADLGAGLVSVNAGSREAPPAGGCGHEVALGGRQTVRPLMSIDAWLTRARPDEGTRAAEPTPDSAAPHKEAAR